MGSRKSQDTRHRSIVAEFEISPQRSQHAPDLADSPAGRSGDAKVTACITLDSGARYDAEVVVTALMSDVGMFDLFGVANGVVMTATAVMRKEGSKPPILFDINTGDPIKDVCTTSIL